MKPRVAIVGAGWAGLAAAIELSPHVQLSLFEAGRTPGGRARQLADTQHALDNGQHILLGAYQHCLRLMQQVGVNLDAVLWRQPLTWVQHDGIQMRCPALPAPWHVLIGLGRARGVSWSDKLSLLRGLIRLTGSASLSEPDQPVADWLHAHGQSAALIAGFWSPLVLSALNTPLAIASRKTLAMVLRDSLAAGRAASDLLLPRCDLSSLFPLPAVTYLQAQGATCHFQHRVASLVSRDGAVWVDGERFDAAIVATAPWHAVRLLEDEGLRSLVKDWRFLPIYTVYLRFACAPGLPEPMTGLHKGTADWLFDREQLCAEPGLLAAVISAPDPATLPALEVLPARVLQDVLRICPHLPAPLWSQVRVERRATFAASVGLQRPDCQTVLPSVWLAGDWVDPVYPATLEGAVRSGVQAAARLLATR